MDLMIIISCKFKNNKTAKETDGKENLRAWACSNYENTLYVLNTMSWGSK